MAEFKYEASQYVPFKDKEVIERCRAIKREDITKHPNPNYRIHVLKDGDMAWNQVTDIFRRVKESGDKGEKLVMILPNPNPLYRKVAALINACRVDCSRIYAFAMDEYADQDGNIAPEDWPYGFTYAMMNNFYYQIDEDLRPPKDHFVGFNNSNLNDFEKMIADLGGADICYSGPGWTGHLAFIEPDAPEFDAPLEEWKQMGPRIVTLSPFTLAQNSLHGIFGKSGDLSAVPPKAATIGPKQVIEAKQRYDNHALSIHGTSTSWQRMMTRLVLHGPVTPKIPESILQTLDTDVYVSENAAANIETDWEKGY
jgi:glucosamine-6-phosphate deaminase